MKRLTRKITHNRFVIIFLLALVGSVILLFASTDVHITALSFIGILFAVAFGWIYVYEESEPTDEEQDFLNWLDRLIR